MIEIGRKGAMQWPYYGGYSSAYMDADGIKYQVRKIDENDYAICTSSVEHSWEPIEYLDHSSDYNALADGLREIMTMEHIPVYHEPWPYGGGEEIKKTMERWMLDE